MQRQILNEDTNELSCGNSRRTRHDDAGDGADGVVTNLLLLVLLEQRLNARQNLHHVGRHVIRSALAEDTAAEDTVATNASVLVLKSRSEDGEHGLDVGEAGRLQVAADFRDRSDGHETVRSLTRRFQVLLQARVDAFKVTAEFLAINGRNNSKKIRNRINENLVVVIIIFLFLFPALLASSLFLKQQLHHLHRPVKKLAHAMSSNGGEKSSDRFASLCNCLLIIVGLHCSRVQFHHRIQHNSSVRMKNLVPHRSTFSSHGLGVSIERYHQKLLHARLEILPHILVEVAFKARD
mmetsp:Transcript_45891/g.143973  ORF Transcript_45891/g.143973 Transcript_45891/m.143973 type:complete len:294 (+) Transcript_45891:293-1174(+)